MATLNEIWTVTLIWIETWTWTLNETFLYLHGP
jgi:hypothetical protein